MNIEELKQHRLHFDHFMSLPLEVMNELFTLAETAISGNAPVAVQEAKPKKAVKPDTLETSQ